MKRLLRTSAFLGIFIFLIACSLITSVPISTATLDSNTPITSEPVQTIVPSPIPLPTYLPTIAPESIPELLRSSFVIQTLDGLNGYPLRKVTGWEYGFRPSGYCFGPYQWMDQNHLLLFPLAGQEESMGTNQLSLPIVIDLEAGNVWIPSQDNLLSLSSCDRPLWSQALNILIAVQGRETIIFSPDGNVRNRYPGVNPSLSPSGTKLMAGGVWIDLRSGKQVDFSSQGIEGLATWSSAENQLYSCCYAYGDARTGKADRFELGGLTYVGRDYGSGFTGIKDAWVMNDTYIVTFWDFQNDNEHDIFPLIEPAAQTYKRLQDLTDIPDDTDCRLGSVAPDKNKIWVNCYQPNNYLVNLETFAADPYPGNLSLISWSSNSEFAWLRDYTTTDTPPQLLSVPDKEMQSLPVPAPAEAATWHPTNSILAYLGEGKQNLVFFDPQGMSVQELALPMAFRSLHWSPTGEFIALTAEAGSLWRVDYPNLSNLEQLTPALPDTHDVTWSPDGTSVAFISGADIYIVDTMK